MKKRSFTFHHLLMSFACVVLPLCCVSMPLPQRTSSGMYGDVNGSGAVDVDDLNEVINVILDVSSQPVYGDVNGNGKVDVDDLNEVINVILGKQHGGSYGTKTFTVNGVGFNMIAVEGGTFMMGSAVEPDSGDYDWDFPAHRVTLSGYSIGETEVTQELWVAVMGSNPSYYNAYGDSISGSYHSSYYYGINLQRPVEHVTWTECQTFIAKLNALTGETFRLPTEAEWEYAARGGNKSKGYKYAGSNTIGDVAWYYGNRPTTNSSDSNYGTQMVATKAPNELGLYDMSGNVWEWCQDWYGSYSSEAQTNPTGPTSGSGRVDRGGSWGNGADYCRVSFRHYFTPGYHLSHLGLRLAR